jgi:hypothetical protein
VLRVAFAHDTPDAQVIVCTRPTEQDASCAPIPVMGYPVDAVSNMTTTVIVTNETLSGEGGIAATDLSGQSTYRSAAGCAAVRAIGLSETAELQVLGYWGDPVIPVIESFLADGGTTFAGSNIGAPANQTGILSLSVEDTTGALWLAGCFGCTDTATSATFFETDSSGSVLGGGEIGASTDFLVATDVYALRPGALVVGLYLSKQEGFFSTIVPPGDDGGAPLNVTCSPLSTGALVVEPSGHTRLAVSSTTGLPKVIVGSLHGQPALALSSLGGDGLPMPDTQALQTVLLDSLAPASVFVGGAVITSGALRRVVLFRVVLAFIEKTTTTEVPRHPVAAASASPISFRPSRPSTRTSSTRRKETRARPSSRPSMAPRRRASCRSCRPCSTTPRARWLSPRPAPSSDGDAVRRRCEGRDVQRPPVPRVIPTSSPRAAIRTTTAPGTSITCSATSRPRRTQRRVRRHGDVRQGHRLVAVLPRPRRQLLARHVVHELRLRDDRPRRRLRHPAGRSGHECDRRFAVAVSPSSAPEHDP